MVSMAPIAERIIAGLASDLGYPLDSGELQLYLQGLKQYPIADLAQLSLDVLSSGDYNQGNFPSLSFMQRGLDVMMRIEKLEDRQHG